jgi:hypothetical protein
MDSVIADTSMGLMKAFHFLTMQQRRTPTKKFDYLPAGSTVHASRCLSKEERNTITGLVTELSELDPKAPEDSDRIKQLISELSKQPVNFVPVKRERRIDRSKSYPYRSMKRGGCQHYQGRCSLAKRTVGNPSRIKARADSLHLEAAHPHRLQT